ncbi:ribosome biogenesis GTP-binding protein YihA/YsxC [Uliginosibacterium sp. H1]|uniref:ribosome biogenesis GTP-binding protein YihA/YsxC n=1 Tax=Uliginosibacterium sp. H1 TaxID=3114757 RepID=UPI002E190D0E|nr:ribosome biogenesis GTP-binding protein YihA/YsxC [Uliginosibacterium sp. H1]
MPSDTSRPASSSTPAKVSTKVSIFRHAQFEISIARPQDLPPARTPEIAFAGRSNAGKSSAINALVGHTRLAYVSKTPGRTQLINVFRMRNGAALIDLPGYGYAQVPEAVRKQWVKLLENYLTRRESLLGLILIMDSRHPLTPLDRQMLDWFAPSGRPVHVLLTKSDKLTRSAAAQVLAAVRRELPQWGERVSVQLFSSLKKSGLEDVELAVAGWLDEVADATAPADPDGDEKPEAQKNSPA